MTVAAVCLLATWLAPALAAEQVVSIPTREGVTASWIETRTATPLVQ